jgi:hypothetical protein
MGRTIYSRIRPPDVGSPTLQTKFESKPTEHVSSTKCHFTHEPRAVTMKTWEPKESVRMLSHNTFKFMLVWSRTVNCSVKSYVTMPSTKGYFNEFLFMWVLTHDKIKQTNGCECSERHGMVSRFCARLTSNRLFLKLVHATMKRDIFNAM